MKSLMSLILAMFLLSVSITTHGISAQEGSNDILKKLFPEDETQDKKRNPEEYNQDSFPEWAYYVYRFGAIAVGSIPFSLLFASVGYDTYKTIDYSTREGSYQSQYMPLYFSGPDKPAYESDEVKDLLLTTVYISIGISTIDLVIQLIKQRRGKTIQSFIK